MFLKPFDINDESVVTDLVMQDYRTSYIFRKYGIDYCCGGKMPLQMACSIHGLDIDLIKYELTEIIRNIQVSTFTDFRAWNTDFLVDYLINVHHAYLLKTFPDLIETLDRFVAGHKLKYPFLGQLLETVYKLRDDLLPHLEHEEKIIFPYIKQIAHAYENNESYASLLVKTLRKPIETMMTQEHEYISKYLHSLRELTNNYTSPANACVSHKVSFLKLKELDDDLVQHLFLENEILFAKTIQMEKELLAS
ncbi:DUF542 domain-containing protein [Terrimonas pollutisoli]|uniref:DUF542 domain-containing protein n=1 Tax=Terrimonas pollutisoli TaxID=3034147 RepID=UPI0023EAF0AD|nr:DUF542 domain-containing protein [Terrimonas sp. H1YJ31]